MIPDVDITPVTPRSLGLIHIALFVCTTIASLFLFLCLLIFLASKPPIDFPEYSSITVERGASVIDIAEQFKDAGYVRSSNMLYAYLVLFHDTSDIHAGTYSFEEPLNARALARSITEIGPTEELLSLTFPEGVTVREIATIAKSKLPQFDTATFLSYALEKEGYLFPDTYFVPDTYTAAELYDLLLLTYSEKTATLATPMETDELNEYEVLVLASIIEREANTEQSMRLVSGILQNRMAIGMPLQADASIEYVLDKPLAELVPEDLKIDSPYNTYLNTGLPPTPIGNPGLTAITAVLHPEASDYYYYITDNDGVFHYARTLDEHNTNVARYLR